METLAKDALDKVDVFLRTIAPGFVCLFALSVAAPPDPNQPIEKILREDTWKFVAVGIGIGFTLYAFHLAIVDDLFAYPVYLIVRILSSDVLPSRFAGFGWKKILRCLAQERWARKGACDRRVVSYHERLVFNYSWLVFTYCSAYALLFASLFARYHGYDKSRCDYLFYVGLIALALAIVHDVKVTGFELWMIKEFPQTPELGGAKPIIQSQGNCTGK